VFSAILIANKIFHVTVLLPIYFCNQFMAQATGYAIHHIPVPVPSQDKLGGLRQEGHPV